MLIYAVGRAIVDGGGRLNIFGGIPTIATDYSPMWDLNLDEDAGSHTEGYRSRLTEEFQILGSAKRGWITVLLAKVRFDWYYPQLPGCDAPSGVFSEPRLPLISRFSLLCGATLTAESQMHKLVELGMQK